ncbi:MAG: GNAT family N-acetyltransferase [Nocardioidaceae bacterium]
MRAIRTRPLELPADLEPLRRVDASSQSDSVLEVSATARGFRLTEVRVEQPVVKAHDFATELTDPHKWWTEASVACVGGQPVGFMSTVYHSWNRRQLLWGLYVDRHHRGRGIGGALVEVALERGRENLARQLWLETQNTNLPAVRAYQAMGFDLVGLDRTLYAGAAAHDTALYLARPL